MSDEGQEPCDENEDECETLSRGGADMDESEDNDDSSEERERISRRKHPKSKDNKKKRKDDPLRKELNDTSDIVTILRYFRKCTATMRVTFMSLGIISEDHIYILYRMIPVR